MLLKNGLIFKKGDNKMRRRGFHEIKIKEVVEKTPLISPVTQRFLASLPDKIELSDLLPDESGERHYNEELPDESEERYYVGELPDESGEKHYVGELPDESGEYHIF